MSRNVLLVEPRYPTKFPPLGLMKLSTYHKRQGDAVRFVKGTHGDLAFEYWDRIYITTLFTYHWKITVEDILFYKNMLHGDTSRIFVGGIMASLMTDALWKETGISPTTGILDTPGMFGDDDDCIIDDLIPDYGLFSDSNGYTLLDSYFGYLTRGCVNKCPFCGVPILEPQFRDYRGLKPYVEEIDKAHGEKHHLVLFDNNIVASEKFSEVIEDFIDLGFYRGAKLNNRLRHVDFNQGTDARLLKDWHFKLLAKIAISPLRIAFDHVKYTKVYSEKMRLAAKYEIQNLSNYILYNYDDTPRELWRRLKLNIDFNRELGLKIYSFPMKYIPFKSKDRAYINEPNWNWQFIRGVQRILNVTKGTVMTGEDFFYRAFGESEEEFIRILHMPENILMHRKRTPGPKERSWVSKYENLTDSEKRELLDLLCGCRAKGTLVTVIKRTHSQKLKDILEYYLPDSEETDQLSIWDE
jgi:hypothetical protein